MTFWVFLIIILVFIFFIISIKRKANRDSSYVDKPYTPVRKPQRIEDCASTEDIQYQISSETQRIIAAVEANKDMIKSAMVAANKEVNTAWLNSYEKVIKISANLDENLRYHAKNNLVQSKFHYYTSLHFRSMIAADIVHKEYCEIDANFNDINNLIVTIAKTGNTTGLSKAQIFSAKDALKELRKAFLDRVHELNKETATLRDKIGRECGERGARWREERMRNHS